MHIFDGARQHLKKMREHEHCCGTPQVRGLLAEGERLRTALLTVGANLEAYPVNAQAPSASTSIHNSTRKGAKTMKVEFKDIAPPPPRREVVIVLSVEDAKLLHNELYAIIRNVTPPRFTLNRLINALTEAHVQNT
jgi:hypothetical protein